MKVTYIILDPDRYPRLQKIVQSIKNKPEIDFKILYPKIRIRPRRLLRLPIAIINYFTYFIMILFASSDIFMIANCPDLFTIPIIFRKKPYIFEYRSPWSDEIKQQFGQGLLYQLGVLIEDFSLKHSKVITLTTSKLIGKVQKYKKPYIVIPNYPSKTFKETKSKEELKKTYGIKENDRIVLFVGSLNPIEGIQLLPEIISETTRINNHIKYWIVGDGLYLPLFRDLEKILPIKVFGRQPYEEIPNFINASDLCIIIRPENENSQNYNEEGVLKIGEYMAFKKPIIACGISPSDAYILVKREEMTHKILEILDNVNNNDNAKLNPLFWENVSEPRLLNLFSLMELVK